MAKKSKSNQPGGSAARALHKAVGRALRESDHFSEFKAKSRKAMVKKVSTSQKARFKDTVANLRDARNVFEEQLAASESENVNLRKILTVCRAFINSYWNGTDYDVRINVNKLIERFEELGGWEDGPGRLTKIMRVSGRRGKGSDKVIGARARFHKTKEEREKGQQEEEKNLKGWAHYNQQQRRQAEIERVKTYVPYSDVEDWEVI